MTTATARRPSSVGYAYVMNKLDSYLENDPREKALRDAVYRAIARLTARTRALEMVGAAKPLGGKHRQPTPPLCGRARSGIS